MDYPFINDIFKQVKKFSDKFVLISYDKFFDNTLDKDLYLLCDEHYVLAYTSILPARFWHNYARFTGYKYSDQSYDMYLFLDGDEVPDGDKVKNWLDTIEVGDYKLANYWYYRDTCYQAQEVEDSAVLLSAKTLKTADFFLDSERDGLSTQWQRYQSYNMEPMIHHYSWAKPKDTLYKKIKTWAHKDDNINWEDMLDEEFSQSFQYKCPFKPYSFTKVKPFIGKTFNEDTNTKTNTNN